MTNQSGISNRLQKLRNTKGWSMKTVAARIGVPVSTYRDWEYGKAIRGEPYEKIAKTFGITVGELLTGTTKEDKATLLVALAEAKERLDHALHLAQAL